MITIGVDFHKRTSSYCVLDKTGKKIKQSKFENRPELICKFLNELPGPKQLAMEATRNWPLFYETAKDHVDRFLLGHPKKMKAITASETKHDRKDAEMISCLTFTGFLPQAHIASTNTRELRSLLRLRYFLIRQRTAIRNQTQILLDRNLWPVQRPTAFKDIFCLRGLAWMKEIPLPARERFILNQLLESYAQLTEKIMSLGNFVEQQACDLAGIPFLRTVCGFKKSKIHLYIVLTEIDDIHRFRKARHLAHYAGLIPSEHSSGDHLRHGGLVKASNPFLRLALIESTFGAIRSDAALRQYYQTVKQRCGSGAAIIACARKLAYAVYHVLKHQKPFYPFSAGGRLGPVAAV